MGRILQQPHSHLFRCIAAACLLATLCTGLAASTAIADHEKAFKHYVRGDSLLVHGEVGGAVEELKRAVHEDFEFAEAHAKLASAYFRLGTIEGRRLSVEEYRLATRYDPDNSEYHLRLGRVYAAQSFDRPALDSFHEAIELAPDQLDAYLASGRLYIRKWRRSEEDLEEAYEVLLAAYDRGLKDRDLFYHLGQVANELEHYDIAEEVLLQAVALNPLDVEARLQYAAALQEQERPEEAEAEYVKAISEAPPEDKESFLGIDQVASSAFQRRLRNLDSDGVADLVRGFWRTRDPNLGTRVNERLLEHWRRLLDADFRFSVPELELRGRDTARGRAYVRYGPATNVFSGIDDTQRSPRPDEVASRIPGSYIHNFDWGEKNPRPVEVWTYQIGGRNFELTFRDRFLDGRFDFAFDLGREAAADWAGFVKEVPQFYIPEYEGEQIRIIADACSFRGEGGTTRQEIYYAVPASDLEFRFQGEDIWRNQLSRQIVIYDEDWHVVAEETVRVVTEVGGTLDNVKRGALIQHSVLTIEPGRYLGAISLEDKAENLMAVAEVELEPRSFKGPGVQVSDLLVARSIRPSDRPGPLDKAGLKIEPAPSHRFQKRSLVNFYYEIYSLEPGEDGRSRFQVTVRLIPLAVKEAGGLWQGIRRLFRRKPITPPHVASTFRYEEDATSVPRHLALDLSPLREGKYRLSVDVDDLVGTTTATASTTVWISQ